MAITYGNRVAVQTSTTGTGTITLGSVVSAAYLTFSEAGIGDGATVHYLISEGADFEIGQGTYTASGTTLSRDTVYNSKISGTAGTTKMTLGGGAEVRVIASAASFSGFKTAWTLLNETTVSVSAADVEWDNSIITGDYDEYMVVVWDAQHDNGATAGIALQFSFDNGLNYSNFVNCTGNGNSSYYYFLRAAFGIENAITVTYSGSSESSAAATVAATRPEFNTTGFNRSLLLPDGEAIDAVRVIADSSGNITAGTFQIWGR